MQVLPACRGVHRRRARGGHEPREPAKGKEGSPPSYVYPDSDDGPDEGKDKKTGAACGLKKSWCSLQALLPWLPWLMPWLVFTKARHASCPTAGQGSNPRRLRSAVRAWKPARSSAAGGGGDRPTIVVPGGFSIIPVDSILSTSQPSLYPHKLQCRAPQLRNVGFINTGEYNYLRTINPSEIGVINWLCFLESPHIVAIII